MPHAWQVRLQHYAEGGCALMWASFLAMLGLGPLPASCVEEREREREEPAPSHFLTPYFFFYATCMQAGSHRYQAQAS